MLKGSLLLSLLLLPTWVIAQTSAPSLRGQVLDPSGAAIPALTVTVVGPTGTKLVAQTDEQGKYAFRNLAPGAYTLTVSLKGFEDFAKAGIIIARGKPQVVNAQLAVAMEKQQVTVTDTTTKVNVNPEENASSLVMKGKDIEALSDDPDELQSELESLAGPSAGPNGGQIYIDGFTGGQLPPKSSIREIRVNQNPFSAQYDTLGYGRIQILTKPGTDRLHGQIFITGNDSAFNTRNPFATQIPGYHSEMFDGNIGGPLGKKTSYFFDGQRRNIQDDAIVSAYVLDSNFNQIPFSQALATPQTRTELSPRLDTQFGSNNTLTIRYSLWKDSNQNQGVGQFSLPSQAHNSGTTEQTLQVSDAQVLSEKAVTEVRFRYIRENSSVTPLNSQPTIAVTGAFTGGGTSAGTSASTYHSYELQNYTSVALNKHFLKFGARLRDSYEAANSTSTFNGVFTFPSLTAYQITEQGLQNGLTSAQIQAAGGGPSQFVIIAGNPLATVQYFDLEPYVEDDWKVFPKMTVSAGLRVETQSHIRDHADFAPRVGIAWGLGRGKSAKTVLRTGAGIFYDRFGQGLILNTNRLNGINQQEYIVPSPNFFPTIPSVSSLTQNQVTPTVTQMDPNLRAPYTIQSGAGLERQISKKMTASVTYLNTHGVHQFLSRDINAPDPANPGSARPIANLGDLYQYESGGLYNQNQMIANFSIRGTKVSLNGFYTLSYVDANTASAGSFPVDQYNVRENYGRAAYDIRNRIFLGGSWNLPRGFQLFPFIIASSAPPFNITLGRDLNHDSIFNDRPSLASSLSNPANVVSTPWGNFDSVPVTGETIIPPNYGTGYSRFTTNLRLSKTFGFGKEVTHTSTGGGGGGGGYGRGGGLGPGGLSSMGNSGGMFGRGGSTPHRFNLTFSISARNLFNNVNLAAPVGTLNSQYFGRSNAVSSMFGASSAANRKIDFQVRFSF
jgi:hypothetical protein